MYFIIKAVVLFLAMMLSGTFVSAQFFSFHQAPQSYIDGKGQAVSYTGFRNQFEPIGTPGCVMGVVSLRGACTYVSGGLSFSLSGGQNSTQFKVYVPAGVTSFIFSGYLPQGMQAAVAVRMGSAPTRTNPLSATEYANYQAARNLSTVYQRLSAGDEVIMVADGGGSFSLAGNNNFSTPLAKGAWLYFRLINGDYIDTPRATYEIDLSSYIAGYNAITTANGWGGDGDPLENGATVTPSFSIKLNGTLTQGVSSTIGITPSGGTLKKCSASSVEVSASSYANNSVTLTPSSTATSVTITCESAEGGSAKASLQVQTAPATALTTITLSKNSLVSNDVKNTEPTTITVSPNPGAILPVSISPHISGCTAKYNGIESGSIKWITSSTFQLSPDSQFLSSEKIISIDCGGTAKTDFTIKMSLVITPNVEAGTSSAITNTSALTDLTFTFTPTLPAGVSTADLYVFVYVPAIPISQFGSSKTVPLYGYQIKNGYTKVNGNWQPVSNLLLPILFTPPEAYQTSTSSGTSMKVNLGYGVTGGAAAAVKAEYYVAYLPAGTTDWTKLQFIGDKQGSFSSSGIPAFWTF